MTKTLRGAPLVIIDLQKAIDHPDWGERNNPNVEAELAHLLSVWRENGWPVIHVKHNSSNKTSHYRTGQIGNDFKPDVMPIDGEHIIAKTVHSAFIDPALQTTLLELGTNTLIIAGVKTNNSIETTVRHGANLGFDIHLLADGCFTHAQTDWNGKMWSADDVHALTLSNLSGEYCRVLTIADLLLEVTN